MLTGGLCGLLIVFTVTFAGPRIGVAATVGILIAGQLVCRRRDRPLGTTRLGGKIPLHWPRLLGLALLAPAPPCLSRSRAAPGVSVRHPIGAIRNNPQDQERDRGRDHADGHVRRRSVHAGTAESGRPPATRARPPALLEPERIEGLGLVEKRTPFVSR